jgi:hypothetical protein
MEGSPNPSSLWWSYLSSGVMILFILGFIFSIHWTIYKNTIELTPTNSTAMIMYYVFTIFSLIAILLIQQSKVSGTIIHKIIGIIYALVLGGFFYATYYSGNSVIQPIIAKGGTSASPYENTEWTVILRIIIGAFFTAILALLPLWITIMDGIQISFGNSLIHTFQGDIFTGIFLTFALPIGLLPLIWYQFGMNINGKPFMVGLGTFSGIYWLGAIIALGILFFK